MSDIVTIQNLQKSYGTVKALKNISFSIKNGEIFGLLGPNGAGKTTTIRCLTTLAQADSGNIIIDGVSAITQPKQVRQKLGYVAQEVAIDKILTGRELLQLQASLYHLPSSFSKNRIEQLLTVLGLQEYGDRQTGTYSGGIRKRLDLAAGLLHQPQVLVLDEPSVGLDIESRMIVWDFLRQLKLAGTTVLITSHYLEEIDALCDRLAIIDQGEVIAEGSPSSLKDRLGGDRVTLKIKEFTTLEEAQTAKEKLSQLPFVENIIINEVQGNSLNLIVTPNSNPISQIEQTLTEINLSMFSISQSRPSLDDVYLAATGKTLLDAEIEASTKRDLKAEKKQAMK
ncbi:daunorubicin resistance protein DrrA family ABC transporter ATP-binding protein [Geminocystis herdmanii]|uniref:daunorubicin resistance protein DrrA family ABC transporter ATP-binding protein n=1 Tax=Geminocystis herdmanii TaxID=669359 RepID=UPI000346BCCE|nr:daunorubicin resistance protein DrrA family ABC transporter ATP-binding protein [Geminocystis herdmanii]